MDTKSTTSFVANPKPKLDRMLLNIDESKQVI